MDSQVINQGYYHADPHPGNLMRQDSDGSLVYLDFGMMGTIERPLRTGLIKACIHLVNREFDLLARDFVTLGLLPPGSNREKVVPALTKVSTKSRGANARMPLNAPAWRGGDPSGHLLDPRCSWRPSVRPRTPQTRATSLA